MCKTCRREGTKLIFSTRDPDEKPPIAIEPLSPMSKEMAELLALWHKMPNSEAIQLQIVRAINETLR